MSLNISKYLDTVDRILFEAQALVEAERRAHEDAVARVERLVEDVALLRRQRKRAAKDDAVNTSAEPQE
jgi:hypothetical protein